MPRPAYIPCSGSFYCSAGIITVIFSFFFGSENLKAQLIMTTLLAVLIVLILFTILIMDFPFSGDMAVSPDAFKQVLLYLKN